MKNNSSKQNLRPGQKIKTKSQPTNSTVVSTNMKSILGDTEISFDQFCSVMSRLEITDHDDYKIWWSEVGKQNGFPAAPAVRFGIEDVWSQVRIAKGYLRLLNALQQPASAFYDV